MHCQLILICLLPFLPKALQDGRAVGALESVPRGRNEGPTAAVLRLLPLHFLSLSARKVSSNGKSQLLIDNKGFHYIYLHYTTVKIIIIYTMTKRA